MPGSADMSPAHLEQSLASLVDRHRELLAQLTGSFETLSAECGKLQSELAETKLSQTRIIRCLAQSTTASISEEKPELPALPPSLDASPRAGGALRSAGSPGRALSKPTPVSCLRSPSHEAPSLPTSLQLSEMAEESSEEGLTKVRIRDDSPAAASEASPTGQGGRELSPRLPPTLAKAERMRLIKPPSEAPLVIKPTIRRRPLQDEPMRAPSGYNMVEDGSSLPTDLHKSRRGTVEQATGSLAPTRTRILALRRAQGVSEEPGKKESVHVQRRTVSSQYGMMSAAAGGYSVSPLALLRGNRHSAVDKDTKRIETQRTRLRALLNLEDSSTTNVSVQELWKVLQQRDLGTEVGMSDLEALSTDIWQKCTAPGPLRDAIGRIGNPDDMSMTTSSMTIPVEALVHLISKPALRSCLDDEHAISAAFVFQCLQTQTASEIVEQAVGNALRREVVPSEKPLTRSETMLNLLVCIAVLVSMCVLATKPDFHPESLVWNVLETFACVVFIFEIIFKLCFLGVREYMKGSQRWWNLADVALTAHSLIELLWEAWVPDHVKQDISGATEVSSLMKILRIARVVRLLKFAKLSGAKDALNMLVGLIIGMQALASVIGIFVLVLFCTGLVFRFTLGPESGQEYLSVCGDPDHLIDWSDTSCPIHILYGEVYFKSVKVSMSSVFRLMMGEYSSYEGKSLVLAFGRGYGDSFDASFCVFMICVYFGLFNTITAIFVDCIITGLKHNESKRKTARSHERHFLREKLAELVDRVTMLHNIANIYGPTASRWGYRRNASIDAEELTEVKPEKISISAAFFESMMEDELVASLLDDLNISIANPQATFELFDPHSLGQLSMVELIHGLMKLRGSPQKQDMMMLSATMQSISERLDRLACGQDGTTSQSRCSPPALA